MQSITATITLWQVFARSKSYCWWTKLIASDCILININITNLGMAPAITQLPTKKICTLDPARRLLAFIPLHGVKPSTPKYYPQWDESRDQPGDCPRKRFHDHLNYRLLSLITVCGNLRATMLLNTQRMQQTPWRKAPTATSTVDTATWTVSLVSRLLSDQSVQDWTLEPSTKSRPTKTKQTTVNDAVIDSDRPSQQTHL